MLSIDDPNELLFTKETNCIGYAAFCATASNYLFRKNNLENEWIARPAIAQLYVLGVNIHPFFNSPFFKDHDMVVIENRITGDRLGVDPTVSDYLGIDQISIIQ